MWTLLRDLDLVIFLALFGFFLVVGIASWASNRDKLVTAVYLSRMPRGSCGAGRSRGAAPVGAARVYSVGKGGNSERLPAASRFWSGNTGVFETDTAGYPVTCSCSPLDLFSGYNSDSDKRLFFVRVGAARACGGQEAKKD
jgi:hypothetical protein